jgi:hypothetical protein
LRKLLLSRSEQAFFGNNGIQQEACHKHGPPAAGRPGAGRNTHKHRKKHLFQKDLKNGMGHG